MVDVVAQSAAVNEVIGWMLDTLQPPAGWRVLDVEFKPTSDGVWMQARVNDGSQDFGMAGGVEPGSSAIDAVVRMQDASFQEGTGSWLTALLRAEPKDDGHVSGQASFNFDQDPGAIAEEDGEFTGEQLVAHLQRYPRSREHVPDWMVQRIESAGLQLP